MFTHEQRRLIKRTYKTVVEANVGAHSVCERNLRTRQTIDTVAEDGRVIAALQWRDAEGPVVWWREVSACVPDVKRAIAEMEAEAEGQSFWWLHSPSELENHAAA